MIYDKDIREPLFDFLEEVYGKVRVIEEKTIGKSRADVFLVLEDGICGVEIKSDADTYARLSKQVKDYDRFFDMNYVVVGTSHAMHIEEHVPKHWGIITVEDAPEGLDFYILREPKRETKTSWERKLGLLWRPELAAMLEHFSLPKYRDKSKAFVVANLVGRIGDKLPEEKLQEEFVRLLFERDYSTIEQVIAEYKESVRKTTGVEHTKKRTARRRRRRIVRKKL